MFRKNIFLSMLFILCFSNATCMDISSIMGQCVVNGRVFSGNSVSISNGKVYVDGVLQDDSSVGSISQSNWDCKSDESKSISVDNNSEITIENSIGNIEVSSYEKMQADLLISKLGATKEDLEHITAEISQMPSSLSIKTKQRNSKVCALINYRLRLPSSMQFFCNLTNCSGNTSVQRIRGQVDSNSVSGEINLEDIDGIAKAKSTSGNIRFNTITGNATINTQSGSIRAEKLAALLSAKSMSGNQRVSNVAGTFNGKSMSGTIKLKKKNINAPITISTMSGDIEICSETFNAMLNVGTMSGDFTSDFAMPIKKRSKNICAQVGSGGPEVSLKTMSGDIELTEN